VSFAQISCTCNYYEYSGDVSVFAFEVKFYPPDPAILQEDITRFAIFVVKLSFLMLLIFVIITGYCYTRCTKSRHRKT